MADSLKATLSAQARVVLTATSVEQIREVCQQLCLDENSDDVWGPEATLEGAREFAVDLLKEHCYGAGIHCSSIGLAN